MHVIRAGMRRIKGKVHDHIAPENTSYRRRSRIRTLHVVSIDKTPEKVARYALKAIGKDFDEEHISIWPGPPLTNDCKINSDSSPAHTRQVPN